MFKPFLSGLVCLLSLPALAITYIVPPDRDLIQQAAAIVLGTAIESHSELTDDGNVVTVTTLRVSEVLKGDLAPGTTLQLTELGGIVGNVALAASGSPVYEPGRRYLVFTDSDDQGRMRTLDIGLGQYQFESDRLGRILLVRPGEISGLDGESFDVHDEKARDAAGFVAYIRGIVAQNIDPAPRYFVAGARLLTPRGDDFSAAAITRASYLFSGNFRWSEPSVTWVTAGSQPGFDGVAAATFALGLWTSDPNSNVEITRSGQDDAAIGGGKKEDNKNAILLNDPNKELDSSAARAFLRASGSYTLDGETYFQPSEVDIVTNDINFFTQSCLNQIMTHEVGHTLGLRHSNEGKVEGSSCPGLPDFDCTTQSMMVAIANCGAPFTGLQTWDRNAISTVYGSGPPCTAPSIATHPASATIAAGASRTLTVVAAGTGPFTYQWFTGTSGNTSSPISGATNDSVSVTPASTTTYWVRVGQTCGTSTVNSNSATVTVNQCLPPLITTEPQDQTIVAGNSATLFVGFSGTNPTVTWYEGQAPDKTRPVGSQQTLVTAALTQATFFWAEVRNSCGTADSRTVRIDMKVNVPRRRPTRR